MARFFYIVIFAFSFSVQAQADAILGTYLNPKGNAKIEIYQTPKGYEGKIVWMEKPLDANGQPKTDKNNNNKALRNRPVMGLITLSSLTYKNNTWSKGVFYNPERGGTVNFSVVSITDGALTIKISKGFFSKEIVLKRV